MAVEVVAVGSRDRVVGVQRVLDEGYDLAEFYRGLADSLRVLMVTKLEGPDAATDVREDLRPAYALIAESFGRGDLLRTAVAAGELATWTRPSSPPTDSSSTTPSATSAQKAPRLPW